MTAPRTAKSADEKRCACQEPVVNPIAPTMCQKCQRILPSAPLKCDFCSATEVRWSYPVRDHAIGNVEAMRSLGEWAACDTCHGFIERTDRNGLARHSTDRFAERHREVPRGVIAPSIRQAQDVFWRNREGQAKPL